VGLTFLAGPIAQAIPQFILLPAGFMLRKKSPFVANALVASALVNYIGTLAHPLATMFGKGCDLNLAQQFLRSDIGPWVGLYAVALPAMAIAMYMIHDSEQQFESNRRAIARLVMKQKIPEERLGELFAQYPGKGKILELEEKISHMPEDAQPKEVEKLAKELRKEHDRFTRHLCKKLPREIDEEKREYLKELEEQKKKDKASGHSSVKEGFKKNIAALKAAFAKDKVGLALFSGSMAAFLASLGASAATAVSTILTGGASAVALSPALRAIPLVGGSVGFASSVYQSVKTFKNPASSVKDKALAASRNLFSALILASFFVPSVGLPLACAGMAGLLGSALLQR
jgi:predicted phage tail protein